MKHGILIIAALASWSPGQQGLRREEGPPRPTLASVLPSLKWDVEQDGPLLIVDPNSTLIKTPSDNQLLAPPPGGYKPESIAPLFGRRLARIGSLSALIPERMVQINSEPGPPDLLAGMSRQHKLLLLTSTFTPPQWRLIGSPNGIGIIDLTQQQQRIYRAIIPEPFEYQAVISNGGGGIQPGAARRLPESAPLPRISLSRETRLYVVRPYSHGPAPVFVGGLTGETGKEYLKLGHFRLPSMPVPDPQTHAYGVPIRTEAPNRQKRSDLDFSLLQLAAPVDLKQQDTVGGIVGRIARSTGLELHVDARVTSRPLWILGESAHASDVLQALCLALTGTFRRIGPAYLLTDDINGLRSRIARLSEWSMDAGARLEQQRRKLILSISGKQVRAAIGDAPGEPLSLSPEALDAYDRYLRQERTEGDAFKLGQDEFSPTQIAFVRNELARRNPPHQLRPNERFNVQLSLRLSYLVAGVGRVEDTSVSYPALMFTPQPGLLELKLPPAVQEVALPREANVRALHVGRIPEAALDEVAEKAAASGFNQLWVDCTAAEPAKRLEAAVRIGKQRGLTVVAVVRLLRAEAESPGRDRLDLNAHRETALEYAARRSSSPAAATYPYKMITPMPTHDWFRHSASSGGNNDLTVLRNIAAVPGLRGIAFCDTAPPGYEDPVGDRSMPMIPSGDFGYTPGLRLSFLRTYSLDPIDLVPAQAWLGGVNLIPPVFTGNDDPTRWFSTSGSHSVVFSEGVISTSIGEQPPRNLEQEWKRHRYEANYETVKRAFMAVRTASPALSLFIQNRSEQELGSWFALWERPEVLPRRARGDFTPYHEVVRDNSRTIFLNFTIPGHLKGDVSPGVYASLLKSLLQREAGRWDGITIDLSDRSAEDVLRYLGPFSVSR